MKRKFSKILGVGLSLSLLFGLLLAGAPALADVSQPTVTLEEEEISVAEDYAITFVPTEQLVHADGQFTITVRFPDDTDVPDGALNVDSFEVAASPGWVDGVWDTTPVVAGLNADAVGDEDDLTVIFTSAGTDEIGEGATVRIDFIAAGTTPITNPTDPGTYTLEVQTSEEDDYVESEEYEIEAPTVGGFVYVYNDADVLLATYGGEDALIDAETDGHFNRDDATIEIGTGTYVLTQDLNIVGEGLTMVSDEGNEDTIIDADGFGIVIGGGDTGHEFVLDGFTIDDADTAVTIDAEEVVVKNCVITDADVGISVLDEAVTDVDIKDNLIEDCVDGITFVDGGGDLDDCDVSGNTITGADCDGTGGIVFLGGNDDIDIKDNTITGIETDGIVFADGTLACNNIDIIGNTIDGNDGNGIAFLETADTVEPTDIIIRENVIINNEAAGILVDDVDAWSDTMDSLIMFNDIYDNDDSIDTAADIDNACFNWWGEDDEDEIEDSLAGAGDVEFEPWLTGPVADVYGGSEVEVGDGDDVLSDAVTTLEGKDDAGVNVTGIEDDDGDGADIISAFKYEVNPQDEIDDAIAFYDVFMLLNDAVALDEVNGKIKFYDSSITEESVAHFWTGDFWAECSDQEARDGVVYVDLTEDTVPTFDELEETPFVVVAGEEEAALDNPELLAPEVGSEDVSLKPAFGWTAVDDAAGYSFQLADNEGFVMPLVNYDDEVVMLTAPAYSYRIGLDYDKAYYWRVRAVSGSSTTKKGVTTFEEQSDWVTGIFTTMGEPEEEAPPVVVEEAPPAPVIEPVVEVITPPAQMVTPSWIYVIIGVGAVLVIALLVLIVRTRRVA
jgi:hypothetical protein